MSDTTMEDLFADVRSVEGSANGRSETPTDYFAWRKERAEEPATKEECLGTEVREEVDREVLLLRIRAHIERASVSSSMDISPHQLHFVLWVVEEELARQDLAREREILR